MRLKKRGPENASDFPNGSHGGDPDLRLAVIRWYRWPREGFCRGPLAVAQFPLRCLYPPVQHHCIDRLIRPSHGKRLDH